MGVKLSVGDALHRTSQDEETRWAGNRLYVQVHVLFLLPDHIPTVPMRYDQDLQPQKLVHESFEILVITVFRNNQDMSHPTSEARTNAARIYSYM